jgi:tripartite-type tricarboxylate transporter receptor subunit TctC
VHAPFAGRCIFAHSSKIVSPWRRSNMRCRLYGGALAGLAFCASAVFAQAFPTKPIRWISPYAAGGGADLTTRLVAQRMAEVMGQPIVVDNRIGASGNIGGEIVARAPADGYTVLTITASNPANHAVSDKVPFDLLRDFAYVTQITSQPYILVVQPSLKVHSVKELAAAAAAQPRTLHYGTTGVATLQHFAGVMFGQMTKTEVVHVPYKGGAPATTDFLGGRLQFFFGVPVSTLNHIKSGRMRALAVTSLKRAPFLPELPSIAESGLSGYAVDNWYGIAAPAKTPRDIVMRLHGVALRALNLPELRERLRQDGADAVGNSPEELAAMVRDDLARWRRQVREAGIKPE